MISEVVSQNSGQKCWPIMLSLLRGQLLKQAGKHSTEQGNTQVPQPQPYRGQEGDRRKGQRILKTFLHCQLSEKTKKCLHIEDPTHTATDTLPRRREYHLNLVLQTVVSQATMSGTIPVLLCPQISYYIHKIRLVHTEK